MTIDSAINQAVGKWDSIYQSLNIDVFPKNKHKPCPVCGGRDRFRYDDKNGKGDFICNQCGSGDGINLIERLYHCSTKDAINMIEGCLNLNVTQNHYKTTEKTAVKNDIYICDNPVCKKVEYLLSIAVMRQSDYLTRKGITFNLPLLDGGKIIAPLLSLNGEYMGAQFITPDGNKQLMKGTDKKGSFIAVYGKLLTSNEVSAKLRSHDEAIICEGLATGLTLREFNQDKLIIIALDAGNLIHVAKAIRSINQSIKITIGADNDIDNANNTGLNKAIEALESVGGYLAIPDTDYNCDWNDYHAKHSIDETSKAFTQGLREIALKQRSDANRDIKPVMKKQTNISLSQMAGSQKAELLINQYDHKLSYDMTERSVYHYDNNYWVELSDEIIKRKLVDMYIESGENFSSKGIDSTVEALKLLIPLKGVTDSKLICFNNGVYNIGTNQFKSHDMSDWITSTNGIDYYHGEQGETLESNAPNFHKWLQDLSKSDKARARRVLSAFYMILANRYDWQLFLELTGKGGSGKSVMMNICTALAGKQNTVGADIENVEDKKGREPLINKTLILLPDIVKYIGSGSGLKAITGGDLVPVNPKYKKPYSTKIKAVVLITNNEAMRFTERNGGISRRRVIFDFSDPIKADKVDSKLTEKIEKELPTMVRHILAEFKDPEEAKQALKEQQVSAEALEVKRKVDHITDFCSYLNALDFTNGMYMGNLGITTFSPKKYLYHAYIEYMNSNGLKSPLSLPNFSEALNQGVKDNGGEFMKKRTNQGIRTNLDININLSADWLPKAVQDK